MDFGSNLLVGNEFYQPGERRAAKVQDLFATIANRYDLINDLQSAGLHRAWKRQLVRLAQPKAGELALDICCGTGDLAFSVSRAGPAVVGVDFSAPMLEKAQQRCQTNGAVVPFIQADAQRLPFDDATFDLVTVGYGLRNLADWKHGLAEMWRVARPGARVLVLDFGKPDNRLWRSLYFSYLRCVVPIFGRLFCGNAQTCAYILESVKHYPAQHGVAEQMSELGCKEQRTINLLGGSMAINYAVKA